MSIQHISDAKQLDGILAKSKDKLSQYPAANFLKVDVDQAPDVSGRYRVTAMPTFVFLKGTSEVDRIRGANKGALEDAVKRHSSAGSGSSESFSGRGHTLAGGSSGRSGAAGGETPGAAMFQALDPNMQTLLYLLAGFGAFWYLS
ncbi:thioredoxin-like protein [Epithele typhae]|uniref:thioredoxin-like protein n=1 Tax=Epithele typhae TaxID=378194 RepID=UPI0020084442|nr:thioredoxin-like protein [Epithele typhae]KAH9913312.1 thioredoxin-like protein [Epithele typhae]